MQRHSPVWVSHTLLHESMINLDLGKNDQGDVRGEICGSSGSKCSVGREASLPTCSFVTDECADPMLCQQCRFPDRTSVATNRQSLHLEAWGYCLQSISDFDQTRPQVLPTFASGNKVVLITLHSVREAQVRNRTGVSMAGQRHCFGRF